MPKWKLDNNSNQVNPFTGVAAAITHIVCHCVYPLNVSSTFLNSTTARWGFSKPIQQIFVNFFTSLLHLVMSTSWLLLLKKSAYTIQHQSLIIAFLFEWQFGAGKLKVICHNELSAVITFQFDYIDYQNTLLHFDILDQRWCRAYLLPFRSCLSPPYSSILHVLHAHLCVMRDGVCVCVARFIEAPLIRAKWFWELSYVASHFLA